MARNVIECEFRTSKMGAGGHFVKSDLNNVQTDCWPTTTWYTFTFGQYIYRQVCWERGNIHCVRPLGRNAHNSSFTTLLAYFWNVNQAVFKSTTFLVRCGHVLSAILNNIFYLFIQSSHFVRGICLAKVEHKISQWNGHSVNFCLRHVMIWSTLIFPYCRKVATTLWIS